MADLHCLRRILVSVAIVAVTVAGLSACGSDSTSGSLRAKQESANVFITYRKGGDTFSIAQDGKGKSAVIPDGGIDHSPCSDTDGSHPTCGEDFSRDPAATWIHEHVGAEHEVSEFQHWPGSGSVSISEILGRPTICVTSRTSLPLTNSGEDDPYIHVASPTETLCLDYETGILLKSSANYDPDPLEATTFRESKPSDFE